MSDVEVSISDGVLRIAGRIVDTEYPVAEAIQCQDLVVVRLDLPDDVVQNRNVLCFDVRGELRWVIEESPAEVEDNPYAEIWSGDSGDCFAETFHGLQYRINLEDGSVTGIGLRRF